MNHFLFSLPTPSLLKALTFLPGPGSPREAWPHTPTGSNTFQQLPKSSSLSCFLVFCREQSPDVPQRFWYGVRGPIPSVLLAGAPPHPLSLGSKGWQEQGTGQEAGGASRLGRSHRSRRPCPRPADPAPAPSTPRASEVRPAPTCRAVGEPPPRLARRIGAPGRRWPGRLPPPDYVSVA